MCHCGLSVKDLAALEADLVYSGGLQGRAAELASASFLEQHPAERQRCKVLLGWLGATSPLFTDPCSCSAPGEVPKGTILRLCFERGL